MTQRTNAVNWFEICAADFARARRFYETALGETLADTPMDGGKMAMFNFDQQAGVGGAITKMENCASTGTRTIVYLNVEGKLDAVLGRIVSAGGRIVQPRMAIPPHGFIALIEDTEGNVVGLHSMS